MIRGYFGLPGSGKTFSMTRDAINEADGRVVYANYDVKIPTAKEVVKLERPQDLIHIQDGLCLVDEAGLWMPSFIWRQIPEDIIWKLAQVRKMGLDLLYTAQDPARVVKVLREITFESIVTEKFFRVFVQKVYSGIPKVEKAKKMSTRFLFLKRNITDKYDTMEMVGVLGSD